MNDNLNQERLSPSTFQILCLLALVLFASGCSHNLLTKQDYQLSQQAFMRGDTAKALNNFPRSSENGTFITTMERSYLSLIQSSPDIEGLKKQAKKLEERVRYKVSREARNFFYVQTPEDYYASEHEVIWMHFLLSWGYSLKGQYKDACIEARIAGSLLSLSWSPEGHFDDPAMRLFLAGLWTMCGDWHEARVDLRAAWFLDNSLTWAKELAENDQPPANLFMVLGGPGPDVVWTPELSANPLRSERQVSFNLRGQKSSLSIADKNGAKINTHLSPDAGKWYERHLARESELHELILDSAYGGKAALSSTKAGGMIAATTGLGLAVGLGGSAIGAAIINNAATDEAVYYGLAIISGSIKKGVDISGKGYQKSTRQLKQELDYSTSYRFVRFLPEYLWMGWSDQNIVYPVEIRTPSSSTRIKRPSIINRNHVSIIYLPDNLASSSITRW